MNHNIIIPINFSIEMKKKNHFNFHINWNLRVKLKIKLIFDRRYSKEEKHTDQKVTDANNERGKK